MALRPAAFFAFLFYASTLWAAPPASNAPKLQRLPPKARAVVRKQVGDGRIDRVSRRTEDGRIIFDIETTLAGKHRSLSVSREGEIVATEVFLEELPAAVEETIRRLTTGSTLGEIDKTTEDGQLEYDVDMTKAGASRSFTVGADGALLSMEIVLAEAPPAVQKTIQAETKGAALDSLEVSHEDSEMTYEAEFTLSSKPRQLSVATNGDLLSEDLSSEDLPDPVQKAVRKLPADAALLEFSKSIEDGEVLFDVSLKDDSASWSFNPGGGMVVQENRISIQQAPAPVQTAIKAQPGGEKIANIRKSTEDGETTYDVIFSRPGGSQTITFGADGKISQ